MTHRSRVVSTHFNLPFSLSGSGSARAHLPETVKTTLLAPASTRWTVQAFISMVGPPASAGAAPSVRNNRAIAVTRIEVSPCGHILFPVRNPLLLYSLAILRKKLFIIDSIKLFVVFGRPADGV